MVPPLFMNPEGYRISSIAGGSCGRGDGNSGTLNAGLSTNLLPCFGHEEIALRQSMQEEEKGSNLAKPTNIQEEEEAQQRALRESMQEGVGAFNRSKRSCGGSRRTGGSTLIHLEDSSDGSSGAMRQLVFRRIKHNK